GSARQLRKAYRAAEAKYLQLLGARTASESEDDMPGPIVLVARGVSKEAASADWVRGCTLDAAGDLRLIVGSDPPHADAVCELVLQVGEVAVAGGTLRDARGV